MYVIIARFLVCIWRRLAFFALDSGVLLILIQLPCPLGQDLLDPNVIGLAHQQAGIGLKPSLIWT